MRVAILVAFLVAVAAPSYSLKLPSPSQIFSKIFNQIVSAHSLLAKASNDLARLILRGNQVYARLVLKHTIKSVKNALEFARWIATKIPGYGKIVQSIDQAKKELDNFAIESQKVLDEMRTGQQDALVKANERIQNAIYAFASALARLFGIPPPVRPTPSPIQKPIPSVNEEPKQPIEDAAEQPEQPSDVPIEEPEQPIEEPAEQPEQPIEGPAEQPLQPSDVPIEKPEQPIKEPSEQPVAPAA